MGGALLVGVAAEQAVGRSIGTDVVPMAEVTDGAAADLDAQFLMQLVCQFRIGPVGAQASAGDDFPSLTTTGVHRRRVWVNGWVMCDNTLSLPPALLPVGKPHRNKEVTLSLFTTLSLLPVPFRSGQPARMMPPEPPNGPDLSRLTSPRIFPHAGPRFGGDGLGG